MKTKLALGPRAGAYAFRCLTGMLCMALLGVPVWADSDESEEAEATDHSPVFKETPLDPYYDFKDRLLEKTGATWHINYSMMSLQRTSATKDQTATGQLDLMGTWDVFSGNGNFTVFYMAVHQLAGINNAEFSQRNGNITPITDSDPVHFLRQAWYSHSFFDDRITVMGGKTEPLLSLGGNRFAQDDRINFQAVPLANVSAKDRVVSSPGGMITVGPSKWLDLAFAINKLSPVSDVPEPLQELRLYYVVNATFKPNIPGLGEGNYRFNLVVTERQGQNRESNGIVVSIDQDLGERWGAFWRYDDTEFQTFSSVLDKSISFGLFNRGPFGRTNDDFGFGAFRTRSSQGGRFTEWGGETFYRIAVTKWLDATATVQFVQPAKAGGSFFTVGGRLFLRL